MAVVGAVEISAQRGGERAAIVPVEDAGHGVGHLVTHRLAVELVDEFAPEIVIAPVDTHTQSVGDGAADAGGHFVTVEFRNVGGDAAFPGIARHLRDDVDRAGISVAPVQSALRAFDHLDPFDRVDVVIRNAAGVVDPIDEEGDAAIAEQIGLPANDGGVARPTEAVVEHQTRRGLGDVRHAVETEAGDGFRRRDGH